MADGFAEDYVRAGREELGADADSLAFRFAAVAIVASGSTRAAVATLRDTLSPTYSADSKLDWQRAGELNAAFLVDYDDVQEFADRIPDLTSLMKHRGFAFMMPHKTRSHVLVLSGRDAAAVSDVIKRLQPSKVVPGDGVSPATRRRAGHAEVRGDGHVTGAVDEMPQPVVVSAVAGGPWSAWG
jgi:hypothetical protein